MKTDCTTSVCGSASAVTIDPKKNSFDLLRFFAAALVLYSHQHVLLGQVEPDFLGWTTFGGLGVSIFFFLSGFLVWTSWLLPVSETGRWTLAVSIALLASLLLGARGSERTGVLILAAALILAAQHAPWGSWLTDRLGDLSYGMYIFAFPVQQIVVQVGRDHSWSFTTHLILSFLVTSLLAYVSWHVLERPALRFKPKRMVLA